MEKGKAAIGWDEKWHAPGAKRLPNGRMHGLGFCWSHEWDDSAGTSEIAMYFERNDGSLTILGCRADVGVNAETAYCQIAADELGVPVETVRFKHQEDAGFYTMTRTPPPTCRQRLGGPQRRPYPQAEVARGGRGSPGQDAVG